MIRLFADVWRVPKDEFSQCGWGAHILTSCVVLGAFAVFPSLSQVHVGVVILTGGAAQLAFTLAPAGLRQRERG